MADRLRDAIYAIPLLQGGLDRAAADAARQQVGILQGQPACRGAVGYLATG